MIHNRYLVVKTFFDTLFLPPFPHSVRPNSEIVCGQRFPHSFLGLQLPATDRNRPDPLAIAAFSTDGKGRELARVSRYKRERSLSLPCTFLHKCSAPVRRHHAASNPAARAGVSCVGCLVDATNCRIGAFDCAAAGEASRWRSAVSLIPGGVRVGDVEDLCFAFQSPSHVMGTRVHSRCARICVCDWRVVARRGAVGTGKRRRYGIRVNPGWRSREV